METYPPIIQFPDLAEIQYMPESFGGDFAITEAEFDSIKAEFIFFVKARRDSPTAEEWGFKPVSCMNNWYAAHRCEWRRMTLYWMRNPNFTGEPENQVIRVNWGLNRHSVEGVYEPYVLDRTELSQDSFLAASGCGFNIGEPPFIPMLFHRFHTLMRMPIQVKPVEEKWLNKHNYRLLDTGALASYWVNGWDPKDYSVQKEQEYFKVNAQWESTKKKKEVKADAKAKGALPPEPLGHDAGVQQQAQAPQNGGIHLVRNGYK